MLMADFRLKNGPISYSTTLRVQSLKRVFSRDFLMARATSFEWECIGGRCKLYEAPISLLKEEIIASERNKRRDGRAFERAQLRKLQKQRQEEQQKLVKYLQKHNFPLDVNAVKTTKLISCMDFGSYHYRPLHKAVQEEDAEVIVLLLKYGADPRYKDSKGKTAYDYLQSQDWRIRIRQMFENAALHPLHLAEPLEPR